MTTTISEPLHTSPAWIREMCIEKLLVLNGQIAHATNEQTYDAIKAFLFSNFKSQEDMQALHATFYHAHAYMQTSDQKLVDAKTKADKENIFEFAKCELGKDIMENTYKVWIENLFWPSSYSSPTSSLSMLCDKTEEEEERRKMKRFKMTLTPLDIPTKLFTRRSTSDDDEKELQTNLERLYHQVLPICAPLIRAQREAEI
jgi:hypothetical protein